MLVVCTWSLHHHEASVAIVGSVDDQLLDSPAIAELLEDPVVARARVIVLAAIVEPSRAGARIKHDTATRSDVLNICMGCFHESMLGKLRTIAISWRLDFP